MQYQVQVAKVNSLMFLIYQIEIAAVNNISHWHMTEVTPAFIFHPRSLCKPCFCQQAVPTYLLKLLVFERVL